MGNMLRQIVAPLQGPGDAKDPFLRVQFHRTHACCIGQCVTVLRLKSSCNFACPAWWLHPSQFLCLGMSGGTLNHGHDAALLCCGALTGHQADSPIGLCSPAHVLVVSVEPECAESAATQGGCNV